MSKRVAVVTGASSGIGKATTDRLIAEGYHVVAFARREARLKAAFDKWKGRVHIVTGDVTQVEDVERLMIETIDRFSRIDILINNAGIGMFGPILSGDLSDWHTMIDVNIKGVLNCIHLAMPHLHASQGHIINLASVAAHDVFPNGVVYCATKHAVNAITLGFRKEFRDQIKITNISPGAVSTEFSSHTHDEQIKESFAKNFEGIVITPDDIAQAILHILQLPNHIVVNEYIVRPNK